MKKLIYIFLIGCLLFSCKDPYGDEIYSVAEQNPISLSLKNGVLSEDGEVVLDKDDFTLWVEILERADLYDALNLSGTYTCFVPNNEGVRSFLDEKGWSSVADMTQEYAIMIVEYHTIASHSLSNSYFPDGNIPYMTVSEDYLHISYGDRGINSIYVNNRALLIKLDVEASNGYIHTMDKLLPPLEGSIYTNLKEDSSYSIFVDMLEKTNLSEYLNTVYDEDENGTTIRYRRTLFAVKNSTFQSHSINNIYDLASYLGESDTSDAGFRSDDNLVYQFVAYHILTNMQSTTDLMNFTVYDDGTEEPSDDVFQSRILNTYYKYGLLSVFNINYDLYLNYSSQTGKGIQLVETDWNVKNGIIHTVDNILEVEEPEMANVIFEFTDYELLAEVVGTEIYRNMTYGASGYINLSKNQVGVNNENVTNGIYDWYQPTATNDSYTIAYCLMGSDAIGNNALYKDYLLVDLGTGAWLEMETNAVRRGKYKVYAAYYHYINGDGPIGQVKFAIDGENLENTLVSRGDRYDDGSDVPQGYRIFELGEVEFDVTETHTLRLFSSSAALSGGSNSDYMTWLDYILFEPIEE